MTLKGKWVVTLANNATGTYLGFNQAMRKTQKASVATKTDERDFNNHGRENKNTNYLNF